MTTKRKILTTLFLILFICGGLIALTGEIVGAFLYWFFIGTLLLIAVAMIVITVVTSGDATATGRAIGGGLVIGTVWALIRSTLTASRHKEFLAKPPDGTVQKYTLEQLRQNFLSGKVTPEWVVRSHDETDYRPVSEVLYPAK